MLQYSALSFCKTQHDILYRGAVKKFGKETYTSTRSLSNLWGKNTYDVTLSVNDNKLYTSATLTYFKK